MRTVAETLAQAQRYLAGRDFKEAARLYDAICAAEPRSVEAITGLAICNSHLGSLGTSISLFAHAATLSPDNAVVQTNLGLSLRRAQHTEPARVHYKEALRLDPQNVTALGGLAGSYVNEGNPKPGIAWAQKALAVDSNDIPAIHNLALLLMEDGQWQDAWPHWLRRRPENHEVRSYPGTRWQGEDVDYLIVHGEQGLGDEVMFLGCLPQLMDRVHRKLTIEVAPRLVATVAASFPSANVIGKEKDYSPPRDGGAIAYCGLGDLPIYCVGGIPPKVSGYLTAPIIPDYANAVLIAPLGGTVGTHMQIRNPPINAWVPIIEAIKGIGLRPLCIQYGNDGEAVAEAMGIEFDAPAAHNLTRQAAAIRSCAALVSVQQTALHLGGALGKRTLGVIPNKPAWRYGLRGPMPWYQTVDLYRQTPAETTWEPVISRVADAIERMNVEDAA